MTPIGSDKAESLLAEIRADPKDRPYWDMDKLLSAFGFRAEEKGGAGGPRRVLWTHPRLAPTRSVLLRPDWAIIIEQTVSWVIGLVDEVRALPNETEGTTTP